MNDIGVLDLGVVCAYPIANDDLSKKVTVNTIINFIRYNIELLTCLEKNKFDIEHKMVLESLL